MSSASQEWHDEVLKEEFSTIVESLGEKGARVISIDKTEKGIRLVECCDAYFGTTLSIAQTKRLISELQLMVGEQ